MPSLEFLALKIRFAGDSSPGITGNTYKPHAVKHMSKNICRKAQTVKHMSKNISREAHAVKHMS